MSRRRAAPALALVTCVAACSYNTHFEDCTVRCSADGDACPDGLSCGAEGLCREAGTSATCSTILGDAGVDGTRGTDGAPVDAPAAPPLSCTGLAATCGSSGNDNCCDTAMPIPGGTYYRSYDVASDAMFPDMSFPATVSPFVLDKYVVTVGRFRQFVDAGMGTQANPPAAGAGARALNGSAGQGGWDPSWNAFLAANTATLEAAEQTGQPQSNWTNNASSNESLPMNCITWYEAFAFCTWDGGFLPTEAEWNFAAAGGSDQRAYAWSNPPAALTIDCAHANYNPNYPSGPFCVDDSTGGTNRVGAESPEGDGKWGHSDLGGNVDEWVLDGFGQYLVPCDDCANLNGSGGRVIRSGDWANANITVRTSRRNFTSPVGNRDPKIGFRCARIPP